MNKVLFRVSGLTYSYNDNKRPIIDSVDLDIDPGQLILLIGANGSGKSTLLRCISGMLLPSYDNLIIKGHCCDRGFAWTDQHNGLAYLGGQWMRTNGFTGVQPYFQDIAAGEMLAQWQDEFQERRDELVKVLDIDLRWRMNQVSDGQRQKVRIMLKLLRPFDLCVIDEFTSLLDLRSRRNFLRYLKKESTERGASTIYASHILDNVGEWATHIMFMGEVPKRLDEVEEYRQEISKGTPNPLYTVVMRYLDRSSRDESYSEATKRSIYDSGYESGRSNLFRR